IADYGSADDAFCRWSQSSATLTQLARRLASPALPVALQSALVVSVSWVLADARWRGREWLAARRAASRRWHHLRHSHISVCSDGDHPRLSNGDLCDLYEGVCDH